MRPLNSATLKPSFWCKNFGYNSYISQTTANFVLKFANFCYHGNEGRSLLNYNEAVKLCDLENRLLDAEILAIAPI